MKKLFFTLLVIIAAAGIQTTTAQTVSRQGDTFVLAAKERAAKATAQKTKYNFTDSKGASYPIYISATGRCFVYKVSAKSGKEYKYYLPEDIARTIAKEVGITYKEKAR